MYHLPVGRLKDMETTTTAATADVLVGAALLSIDAQEIINTVSLAIRHHITATELRDSVYTHPSSTEALNEVFDKVIS